MSDPTDKAREHGPSGEAIEAFAPILDPVGFDPTSAIYASGEERRDRVRALTVEGLQAVYPIIRRDVALEIAEEIERRGGVTNFRALLRDMGIEFTAGNDE